MNFKQLTLMAAAAMTITACSSDKLEAYAGQPDLNPESPENAIQFGTYMGKAPQTRTVASGTNGAIKDENDLHSKGFGVFAYYTGKKNYNETQYWDGTNAVIEEDKLAPNFMYNQQVEYSSSWTYNPVKYWPNESSNSSSNIDGSNAGTNYTYGGNLSFFAYAPYVSNTNATVASEGITGFSANTGKGDPIVTYKVPASGSDVVDLLWGTTGTNGQTVLGSAQSGVSHDGSANTSSYPYAILSNGSTGYTLNADLSKQKTTGTVDFAFKHALAKVGGYEGLKIVTDVDAVSGGQLSQTVNEGGNVTDGTKVTVKSISIVAKVKNSAGDAYYTEQKGTLNLATGKWNITGSTGTPEASTTYTISGDKLNTAIAETGNNWGTQPRGVYHVEQNIYKSASVEDPLIFIPGTKPELTVTIDYMVRTKDSNLETGYTEVEQNITKTISFTNVVELNKFYTLVLHLGLTSVKFTASVSTWDNGGNDTTGSRIDLPINVSE